MSDGKANRPEASAGTPAKAPRERVQLVDFAVPTGYTTGPRFPAWQDAVDHARTTITRFDYPGQRAREDAPEFHPRRYAQDGDTLVVYSRAFVHMRTTEPAQDRPGGPRYGSDRAVCTWEVFRDGTVETLQAVSPDRPGTERHGLPAGAGDLSARQQLAELQGAARRVVDNWDHGDLAAAVSALADFLPPRPESPGHDPARVRRPTAPAAAPGTGKQPAPGLGQVLSALAGALLRSCGELTIGGQTYQVLAPAPGQPPRTVYLRREDGRVLAAQPHVRIRTAAPREAGIGPGP